MADNWQEAEEVFPPRSTPEQKQELLRAGLVVGRAEYLEYDGQRIDGLILPPNCYHHVPYQGRCLVKLNSADLADASDTGRRQDYYAYGILFQRFGEVASNSEDLSDTPHNAEVRNRGGRPAGNHGEPAAILTMRLVKLSDAELQRYTVAALVLELRDVYHRLGIPTPSEQSLKTNAGGILRAVRQRET